MSCDIQNNSGGVSLIKAGCTTKWEKKSIKMIYIWRACLQKLIILKTKTKKNIDFENHV